MNKVIDENAYNVIEEHITNISVHSIEIDNKIFKFLIILKKNYKNILTTIQSIACNCNTCIKRIKIFLSTLDNNGNYYYIDTNNENIQKLNNNIIKNPINISDISIEIFDDIFNQNFLNNFGGFQHLPIPNIINDSNLIIKFNKLKHYIKGGFENRLSKIINYHNYLKKIQLQLPYISRQSHWESTLIWALNVAIKANNLMWDEINISDKIKIMIFAILTGNSENSIHYNFQKVENFLDFATDNLNDYNLIEEMNKRSDPNNYMVSRAAKALNSHCITAPMTITLCWNTKSDLDLHAYITDEFNIIHHIYYGATIVKDNTLKVIGTLDFDANYTKILKAPSENISIFIPSKLVRIIVVNYTNRDGKGPIPYDITIRRGGNESDIITSEWFPIHSNNEITITELQIYPEDLNINEEPKISITQVDKFIHKNESWLKDFGNPVSTIVNINLDEYNNKILYKTPTNDDFLSQFNHIINKNKYPHYENYIIILDDFIKFLRLGVYNNKIITFKNFKDIVPAYVTKPETSVGNPKNIVSRNENSICVYYHQNELPMKQDSTKKSLARLDESWFCSNLISDSIKVLAFIEINNDIFCALDGLQLSNSDTFPLAGGFYGSDLLSEYHSHRSQYSCCHSLVKPKYEKVSNHIPLIGTILSSITNIELIIDNQLFTISK
jgi:hypothetical protein